MFGWAEERCVWAAFRYKKNSKQKSLAEHVTCECIIKKKKNQVQIKLVRDMQYKLVDSFIVIINGSSFF